MSNSHGRALADKQNVFHAFSKHFKPRGLSCSPINLCTSNPMCSSSHDKNTDTQQGQKQNKVKRLKKRKERIHLQDGDRGGSKTRSQSHRHHRYRKEKAQCHDFHHHCCKEKAQSHDFCQISSRPPRRDAPFARVFPIAQEPSIITDNRLIGHHGLFNHEVKSFDIERLLSEQRKLEKLGLNRSQQKNHSASLPPPLTSPQLPSPPVPDCHTGDVDVSTTKEARDKMTAERITTSCTKTHTKTQGQCKTNLGRNASCGDTLEDVGSRKTSGQGHLEEEISASHNNSQGTDLTSGQRQTHQGSLTSDSNAVLLLSTDTSNAMAAKRTDLILVVPEMGRESLLPHGGEQGNSIPQDTRMNALTLEQSKLTSSSDRGGASESSDPQQTGTACRPDSVTAVAAQLCRSLEMPLLRRRHLLAESREVLLHTLREQHGSQLQDNLLRVHRSLSLSSMRTTAHHGRSRGPAAGMDEEDGVWPAAVLDAGSGEGGVKQSCFDPERTAGLKRRRKQLCPLRVSPPQTHREPGHGLNLSIPGASSPSVERAEDPFRELFRSCSSSHFHLDIQPSGSSSPHHPMFDPPPASYWGPAFPPPQPYDEGFNRVTRQTTSRNCFETYRYDTDLNFLNETGEVRERSTGCRQFSQQYFAKLPEGNSRHLFQRQDPSELERSHFSSSDSSSSALAQRSLESHQLRPFYRSNRHPPSPTPMSHSLDMAYYPPSHMLESRLPPTRPVLTAFPSPEHWLFPRMRLY